MKKFYLFCLLCFEWIVISKLGGIYFYSLDFFFKDYDVDMGYRVGRYCFF